MLNLVTVDDFSVIEGPISEDRGIALQLAIRKAVQGYKGAGLEERIVSKWGLGRGGPSDGPDWVARMNRAITTWNQIPVKNADAITAAFEV